MKKRLLFISLTLVLVLTMLAPTPVLAKGGNWGSKWEKSEPTPFTAWAEVMVVDPGTSKARGSKIITRGEIVQGTFSTVIGWDDLVDASLSVRHNSIITLDIPDPTSGMGEFNGHANAFITVSFPGNGGKLFGTYRAKLTGEYMFEGDQLVIMGVNDVGSFRVIGRILKDGRTFVRANGDWDASLHLTPIPIPPGYTLAGLAEISGEYVEMSRS